MKKLKEKQIIILVVVVILIATAIYWTKKSKAMGKTLKSLWLKNKAQEFTKPVWFDNQDWIAQVKNINNYDVALLADGRVVLWEPGAQKWVPAFEKDLELK